MTQDTLQGLTPILGAMIGGSLAIISGILVAHITGRREKLRIHLEKIELLHQTATEVLVWAKDHMTQALIAPLGEMDREVLMRRPPVEQLSILTDIYEPSMRDSINAFLKVVEKQQDAQFEYYGTLTDEDGSEEVMLNHESAFDRLNEVHEELLGMYREVEAAIVRSARRRI